ncbi:MAG: HupE/UreJ family protein [Betaproteobacteria bacterium]|nr:HupE/UreJ family protein [Betaproteobacteria bacterium]
MSRALLRAALALLFLLGAGGALAHKASDSYLTLTLADGGGIAGHWDIALRDLEEAVGLDADGDGNVTWGEVRASHGAIAGYALSRLALAGDGRACTLQAGKQQVDDHTDGAYAVIPLTGECPEKTARLTVDYRLLFDLDPQHRGLLRLEAGGRSVTGVLGPESGAQHYMTGEASLWRSLAEFVHEGMFHIWAGFDHLLFLVALLLPAVLVRGDGRWLPAHDGRKVIWTVAGIVTAFTLAHSITLAMAVLGLVTPPSRWVEALIAVSVIAAALDNLRPFIPGPRWSMAFVFGLVHGFGFASVLIDLHLPAEVLAVSLVGFNLGVEIGQLAVVGALLPLAYFARATAAYPRRVVGLGSFAIATVAGGWLVDRAFDLNWMPF